MRHFLYVMYWDLSTDFLARCLASLSVSLTHCPEPVLMPTPLNAARLGAKRPTLSGQRSMAHPAAVAIIIYNNGGNRFGLPQYSSANEPSGLHNVSPS